MKLRDYGGPQECTWPGGQKVRCRGRPSPETPMSSSESTMPRAPSIGPAGSGPGRLIVELGTYVAARTTGIYWARQSPDQARAMLNLHI